MSPPHDPAASASPVLSTLLEGFPEAQWSLSAGQDVVRLPREQLADFARAARQAGFEMCVDVTAIDYLRTRRERFEVVVNLLSLQHQLRLRVLVGAPGDNPAVPSVTPIYPGANFFEREVWDLFGIAFADHPDLSRILMPDDWVGHPLRKDYAVGSVPVQFKDSPKVD